MNLFGRKKADAAPPPKPKLSSEQISAQIEALNKSRELLEKKQQFSSKQAEAFGRQAVERNKKGDKTGAIMFMRRKKMLEKERDKLYGMISQIEAQASMLSAAVVNVEFLGVMQQAQEAHKQVQEHVNVEKVEEMRDMFEEQMQEQEEIDDILGRVYAGPSGVDDSSLLSELADLEEQQFAADMSAVPPVHVAPVAAAPAPAAVAAVPAAAAAPAAAAMSFPAVPTSVPAPAAAAAAAPRSMEDELAALEAAM